MRKQNVELRKCCKETSKRIFEKLDKFRAIEDFYSKKQYVLQQEMVNRIEDRFRQDASIKNQCCKYTVWDLFDMLAQYNEPFGFSGDSFSLKSTVCEKIRLNFCE